MAGKSPTESIRDLQRELGILVARLDGLRGEFDKLELDKVCDQVIEVKARLDSVGELRLSEVRERMAVLEDRVNDLRRANEESGRRLFQFNVLFIGGLVTLAINVVVSFLRK